MSGGGGEFAGEDLCDPLEVGEDAEAGGLLQSWG